MSNPKNEIKVKVQPYPFSIAILREGKTDVAQVLRLAQKGAILSVGGLVFTAGSEFQVSFEIPVHKVEMNLMAKVIKTYDRAVLNEKRVERLIEIQFPKITNEEIRSIHKFLVAIKQVAS